MYEIFVLHDTLAKKDILKDMKLDVQAGSNLFKYVFTYIFWRNFSYGKIYPNFGIFMGVRAGEILLKKGDIINPPPPPHN